MTLKRNGRIGALLAIMAVAACSRSSTSNDSLKRDLDLAGSTSLELAPQASGTQVVSSIEETPSALPAKSTARVRTPARKPAVRTPVHQAAAVSRAPEQTQQESPAATQSAPTTAPQLPATPAPKPVPTPQRRGGYKSEAEIFRNAPFPINP